jgi:AcrR family transcriptional regulator
MSSREQRARKGEQTRVAIIDAALDLAATRGLEGLTIGSLAERMRMSKSGVFAHFGSREDLQIAVLKEYERRFAEDVLAASLDIPRGLPRLRAMLERWIEKSTREAERGCLWISCAAEYDDRPGAVRDELVAMIQAWKGALSRAIQLAIDTGELRPDTDISEMIFDIYGVILVLHHDSRLLASPTAATRARLAIERIIDARRTGPRPGGGRRDAAPVPDSHAADRSVA